jgi:hypothetical protein
MTEDRIIVGRTPSCLLFSWRTQSPCIIDDDLIYHRFDEEFEGYDFSEFNAKSVSEFVTNLSFMMGISGLLLHPGNVESTRFDDQTIVITKNSRKITYDKMSLIFDSKKIKTINVYDEFHWRRGQSHSHQVLRSRSRFCRRVIFHRSSRPRVSTKTKDVTIASIMDEDQLLDPNYGNAMSRIRGLRMMESVGMKGQLGMVKNGKEYYKPIKMDFHNRVVVPKFKQMKSFAEVYEMKQEKEKPWTMFEKLRFKQEISLA